MKKTELKSGKLWLKVLGCIGLVAVVLSFCQCGLDLSGYNVRITGTVKSEINDKPIEGIQVTVSGAKGLTDKKGKFDFYADVNDKSVRVDFSDIDGAQNGRFEDKTMYIEPAHKDEVKINVKLEAKE